MEFLFELFFIFSLCTLSFPERPRLRCFSSPIIFPNSLFNFPILSHRPSLQFNLGHFQALSFPVYSISRYLIILLYDPIWGIFPHMPFSFEPQLQNKKSRFCRQRKIRNGIVKSFGWDDGKQNQKLNRGQI